MNGYLTRALASLGKQADHTAVLQFAETIKA